MPLYALYFFTLLSFSDYFFNLSYNSCSVPFWFYCQIPILLRSVSSKSPILSGFNFFLNEGSVRIFAISYLLLGASIFCTIDWAVLDS